MCQGIIIRIKNQKIVTNEQEIRSLLHYFLKRVQDIFAVTQSQKTAQILQEQKKAINFASAKYWGYLDLTAGRKGM